MVSLIIFVIFFAVVTWYVFSKSRSEMDELSNVPFKK